MQESCGSSDAGSSRVAPVKVSFAESERRIDSSGMAGPVRMALTRVEVVGIERNVFSAAFCARALR
jgi:hypothetical protein